MKYQLFEVLYYSIELYHKTQIMYEIFSLILRYSLDFLVAQLVKNLPAMLETLCGSWVGKQPWRRDRLPIPVFLGFPSDSEGKESSCNAGNLGLIPGSERSPGGGHGNPLQYSCLEDPHGQRSLAGSVYGIAKSWI